MPKLTAYEELAEFVQARARRRRSVDLTILARAAEREFPASFFARLGRERLRYTLYGITQQRLRPSAVASVLKEIVVAAPENRERLRSVFANWYEEVERGRKVGIKNMKNSDLVKSGGRRVARGSREVRHGEWLLKLADRVTGDQTVRDVFTDVELAESYQREVLLLRRAA